MQASGDTTPNEATGPGPGPRALKIVSVACEQCKKARRKCNGEHPCQTCVTKNIDCVFDQSKDGRRGRKRTLDQLASKGEALDALLCSVKTSDDNSVQELVRLIRSDATLDQIVDHTRLVLRENEHRNKSRGRIRRALLDVATLIDEPPVRVPAKPWTNVTDDDHAVSHLISIYFTWQHHGYPCVDQDIFVREMQSQSLSSSFCSPFLVNCILAAACVYTDHPSAFEDPDEPSTRGLHFMNESIRLWALEQDFVTIVNLQALPALITAATALGRDRAGMLYTNQSITLSTELVGDVKKRRSRGDQRYETSDFQKSYVLALWAAFLVQTEVAIAWSKPLALQQPSKNFPYTTEELYLTKVWYPYPKRTPEMWYFPLIIMNERAKLYATAAGLRPFVLSGSPQDSPLPGYIILDKDSKFDGLREVKSSLLKWHQSLPPEAQLAEMDDSVPPEPLMDLHLTYHSFRISTANQVQRMTGLSEQQQNEAEEDVISACRSITQIFAWRLQTIGLLSFGIYTVHASSLSAYGLLEFLTRPGIPDMFHTLIVVLSTTSRRWTLARGITRMIWIELQRRHLDHLLNESTLSLLKLNAVEVWSPADHRVIEGIAYPNYAAIKERGNALSEMGELLEEYSRLHLADHGEDRERS